MRFMQFRAQDHYALQLSKMEKVRRTGCSKENLKDYVSSCGIPLMPVLYQVVGFGRGDGRHSDC